MYLKSRRLTAVKLTTIQPYIFNTFLGSKVYYVQNILKYTF